MTFKEAAIISGMPECILRDMVKNNVLKRSNTRIINAEDLMELMRSGGTIKTVPEDANSKCNIEKRSKSYTFGTVHVAQAKIEKRNTNIIKRDAAKTDYIVRGYATTFEPYVLFESDGKKYYEQIDRRAFDGVDLSDVCFLLNHEGVVLARPRNNTLKLSVDEHGLYVVADLSSTQQARDVYDAIASGLIYQMSFAFTVAEEEFDHVANKRIIKRLKKVFDVACVNLPANPQTYISVAERKKFIEEMKAKEDLELAKRKLLLIADIDDTDKLALAKAKYKFETMN